MPRTTNIQLRKGSSTEWSSANPILDSGEAGFDTTNGILKIGNGTTAWNDLAPTNNSTIAGVYALLSGATFTGPVEITGNLTAKSFKSSYYIGTIFN